MSGPTPTEPTDWTAYEAERAEIDAHLIAPAPTGSPSTCPRCGSGMAQESGPILGAVERHGPVYKAAEVTIASVVPVAIHPASQPLTGPGC